uniref:RNase H type-1 domain-containing protein n=1 Tax=Cannabis sativa TaxID=3483 RepID=A0A803NTK3_CANSA
MPNKKDATVSFGSWFGDILSKNQQAVKEEAAMIVWRLWMARNDVLWNNKTVKAFEVVKLARTNLINVDGAIFEAESRFGVGVVIRDYTEKLIEVVSISKSGVVRPEIAEVIGVKEALSWIKKHSYSDVEIETDSLVVVQAIDGEVYMPSQFGMLVQDCRLMVSSLNYVVNSFVKRSANRAAHCVARQSCFMSGCIFSELNAPSDLLSIVMDERSR